VVTIAVLLLVIARADAGRRGQLDALLPVRRLGHRGRRVVVFFAYIGFDIVATTAEESRNPQRDMPSASSARSRSVTVLYVAVCLVLTGMSRTAS
jgi:L-asparagine transporter-like permease